MNNLIHYPSDILLAHRARQERERTLRQIRWLSTILFLGLLALWAAGCGAGGPAAYSLPDADPVATGGQPGQIGQVKDPPIPGAGGADQGGSGGQAVTNVGPDGGVVAADALPAQQPDGMPAATLKPPFMPAGPCTAESMYVSMVDHPDGADITFDETRTAYTPQCLKVRANTPVVFHADFTSYPLMGAGGSAIPLVNSGNSYTLTPRAPGFWRYSGQPPVYSGGTIWVVE